MTKAQPEKFSIAANALDKISFPWQEVKKVSTLLYELTDYYSRGLGTSPEYIFAAILATISQAAGSRFKWENTMYENYINFYILIVGNVSTNKTHSFTKVFDPIIKIQDKINDVWKENKRAGHSEPLRCLYLQDVTPEAYWDDLENTDDGIQLVYDEFNSFFGNIKGYSQNPGTAWTFFLTCYNSYKTFNISRKVGRTIITKPIPRIFAGTQPKTLDEILKKVEKIDMSKCGLLQRFIIFRYDESTRREKENISKETISKIGEKWYGLIKTILSYKTHVDLKFSDGANEIYEKYCKENENLSCEDYKRETRRKLEMALIRLSMAMAVFRTFEKDPNFDSDIITIADDEMAFARKCVDYFLYTSMEVNERASSDNTNNAPLSKTDAIRACLPYIVVKMTDEEIGRIFGIPSRSYINAIRHGRK